MRCQECGATVAASLNICPICGARQASVPAPRAAPSPAAASAAGGLAAGNANPLPRLGEVFAGRYRVEKYLGVGALCNAFLCRDVGEGNREVVVKIMHARKAVEAGMADSFLFLADSVAKYDHKGIARIYGSGRHEGVPYYVMEWVGGAPLRMWLMERLNFENRVLPGLGIIASLLDTFEAVHERGCYGALKPENVFITLNGPVIMDFGVVGFLSPQEFEFNTYARRYLPYMAPELRQDWSNLLPQSDFHSLGALLYEVLVGRVPAAQLRLPSELSRSFGIDADEIILKAMAQNPLDRFATVEAFKNAVISLQASLLNSRPQDGLAGLSLPGAAAPMAHPSLDVTSDPVSVHNPDVEFEEPGTGTLRMPGTGTLPAGGGEPWMREGTSGGTVPKAGEAAGFPARASLQSASRPEGGAADRDAASGDGRILSDFAMLGDRSLEAAHAQRRFAHGAGPRVGQAAAEPSAPETNGETPAGEAFPGEKAPPVPAWLWILIALAGAGMVIVSAYLGLAGR